MRQDLPKESERQHLDDDDPGSYRQAMTIAARIMILLYGAAGEPSRGEIPMSLNADRRLIASHSVWGLRTNNTHVSLRGLKPSLRKSRN